MSGDRVLTGLGTELVSGDVWTVAREVDKATRKKCLDLDSSEDGLRMSRHTHTHKEIPTREQIKTLFSKVLGYF